MDGSDPVGRHNSTWSVLSHSRCAEQYVGHAADRLYRVDAKVAEAAKLEEAGGGGGTDRLLPALRKLLYQAFHKLFELRRVVCGLCVSTASAATLFQLSCGNFSRLAAATVRTDWPTRQVCNTLKHSKTLQNTPKHLENTPKHLPRPHHSIVFSSLPPGLGVHFTVRRPKLSIRRPIFKAQICI